MDQCVKVGLDQADTVIVKTGRKFRERLFVIDFPLTL